MVKQVNGKGSENERWEWRGWEIKELSNADDTVLVAVTREHRHIVNEFMKAWHRTGMKINVWKSKVLVVKKKPEG